MLKPLTKEQNELLERYRLSNLSMQEFARQENCSIWHIYYLISKMKKLESQNCDVSENDFIKIPLNDNQDVTLIIKQVTIKTTLDNISSIVKEVLK